MLQINFGLWSFVQTSAVILYILGYMQKFILDNSWTKRTLAEEVAKMVIFCKFSQRWKQAEKFSGSYFIITNLKHSQSWEKLTSLKPQHLCYNRDIVITNLSQPEGRGSQVGHGQLLMGLQFSHFIKFYYKSV